MKVEFGLNLPVISWHAALLLISIIDLSVCGIVSAVVSRKDSIARRIYAGVWSAAAVVIIAAVPYDLPFFWKWNQ